MTAEIHASALGGILDCPRRALAKHREEAGPGSASVASVVGRVAHAVFRASAMAEANERPFPPNPARRIARQHWDAEKAYAPVGFDRETPDGQVAVLQAAAIGLAAGEMARTHGGRPQAAELPIHGVIQGLPVVGTIDQVRRDGPSDPARIFDLKTGRYEPLAHAVQIGAYCELMDTERDPVLLFVPRKRHGTDPAELLEHAIPEPLNAIECRKQAQQAAATWRAVLDGDGSVWANPNSRLCTPNTCPVWGTPLCPIAGR